jgi:hypothetical protein
MCLILKVWNILSIFNEATNGMGIGNVTLEINFLNKIEIQWDRLSVGD